MNNQKRLNKKTVTVNTTVTKKNGNENGKQKRKRNRANKKPTIMGPGRFLSPCGKQYMLALCDAERAKAPCIPDFISIPSLKFSVQNRGTFMTGTNNYGYVMVNPSALAYNNGTAFGAAPPSGINYPPAILATNSTYTLSGFQFAYGSGALTAGVDQGTSNSAFSIDALRGSQVKYRLVGCTLKITYGGTELNLGGRTFSCFARGADSLAICPAATVYSSNDLLRDRAAHFVSEQSARKTHFANFLPTNDSDLSYRTLSERLGAYIGRTSTDRVYNDGYSLFLGVNSAVASTVYSYTVTAHFEAIGPILPSYAASFGTSLTKSESDPIGMSTVINSVNEALTSAGELIMDDPQKFVTRVNNFIGVGAAAISGISALVGNGGGGGHTSLPTITEL